MFPTSSTRDGKRQCCEFKIYELSDRGGFFQRSTSLEHIGGTIVELAVFDVNGSEVMMMRQ